MKSFLDLTILPVTMAYLGFVCAFSATAIMLITKARRGREPWGDKL